MLAEITDPCDMQVTSDYDLGKSGMKYEVIFRSGKLKIIRFGGEPFYRCYNCCGWIEGMPQQIEQVIRGSIYTYLSCVKCNNTLHTIKTKRQ